MSDKKKITKEYSNGEVTVVWKPDLCIHSKFCITGLPEVFDFEARPWINAKGAVTEAIVDQVKKCPSGALSFYMNDEDGKSEVEAERVAEIMPDGPLLVYGNIVVKTPDGEIKRDTRQTAFCRCGASENKPFCDGSHKRVGFKG